METRLTFTGITVSNSTFNSLVLRYSQRDGKINFDDYVQCIARLSAMFGILHANVDFTCAFFCRETYVPCLTWAVVRRRLEIINFPK